MDVIRTFLFERLAESLQLKNQRFALRSDSVAARVGNPVAGRLVTSIGGPALRRPVLYAILMPHD